MKSGCAEFSSAYRTDLLKSISGKKLCKIVEQKRWSLKKVTGSHYIYQKPGVNKILSIPVHRNKDLKIGTLKALMKIAGLTEEDLS
ncbi:MAG: type II toxin-antitoxin system HicA family toxin [Xenococcaceae cyanobacterium MO_234.B1]|nr:type II toxin-antitoxin system HicA family toxin [Xenococcaceae cyanobacterium MO_234.B1]